MKGSWFKINSTCDVHMQELGIEQFLKQFLINCVPARIQHRSLEFTVGVLHCIPSEKSQAHESKDKLGSSAFRLRMRPGHDVWMQPRSKLNEGTEVEGMGGPCDLPHLLCSRLDKISGRVLTVIITPSSCHTIVGRTGSAFLDWGWQPKWSLPVHMTKESKGQRIWNLFLLHCFHYLYTETHTEITTGADSCF